jgi:DNA primase catalytic core
MSLNPKANLEVAHCFSCGATLDIFAAASTLEGLPTTGGEWLTETLPWLAEYLEVPISLGEPTEHEKMRAKFFTLARDIADLIQHPGNAATDYMKKRCWDNNYEDCYTVDYEEIMGSLMARGWTRDMIVSTRLICVGGSEMPLLGKDKVTFTIKNHRGQPVAFISRNLDPEAKMKYIHSAESPIFQKRDILPGLDLALEKKHEPLWIVEGTGDRFALLRKDVTTVVSLCGTALTDSHLNHLKTLGISDLVLCLDWDKAGNEAIEKIVKVIQTKRITGFNIRIVQAPFVDNTGPVYKDVGELLSNPTATLADLVQIDLFDWLISKTDLSNSEAISNVLIPSIAAAPTAIQRDILARRLAALCGIQAAAILSDVDRLRNHSLEIRKERILASAQKYTSAVELDPGNMQAAFSLHEQEVSNIDNEFGKDSFGVNYQLSRFDALQTLKHDANLDWSSLTLSRYTLFAAALANGMPWTSGTLIYWGGRANAAKTACAIAIGLDALVSDPDCMVVLHLTDDAYKVVEPRLATNIAYLLSGKQHLTISEAASPRKGFKTPENSALYAQAISHLRASLSEERLLVIDSEDGNNLSVLERTVKYLRRKYPNRKMLVVCDGTHNYSDFGHLDQTARITRIADMQKRMTVKYDCCMFATAEYRKNMPLDTTKIKLPVNDDLADARALMFRASVIIHVYNDLNDRADHADTVWLKGKTRCPRLMLIVGKNKVTGFKERLVLDLDPDTVTVRQIDFYKAGKEYEEMMAAEDEDMEITESGVIKQTDWDDDDI